MIEIKVKGLEDVARKLRDLGQRARELDGVHKVPMKEIFPADFMSKYTDFSSFDEMLDASGFKIETSEHFAAIPDNRWDEFVSARTRFENWKEMKEAGAREYVTKKFRNQFPGDVGALDPGAAARLNSRLYQKFGEGSVNVTLGTLERLCRGFGVDARRLFEG